MSAIQPEWAYRLVHGLMTYGDEHPKLFAQFYPTYEYQPADCPCRLVDLVPEEIRRDAALFMAGIEAAGTKVEAVPGPQPFVPEGETGQDVEREERG